MFSAAALAADPPIVPGDEARQDVIDRFENTDPPPGILAGGFVFRPRLQAGLTYDDNIFASSRTKKSDFIANAGAGARLDSQWVRHAVSFNGALDGNRYIDNDREDYWTGELGARGRLDVENDTRLGAEATVQRLSIPRGDPEDTSGTEPSVFHVYTGAVTAENEGVHVVSRVRGGIQRLEFDNVPTSTGTIFTDDRDRNEYFADGRVGYRYLGPEQVYFNVRGNTREYDREIDRSGFRRSSDGYRADVGATASLGGLIFADVSVGYQEQSYDDPRMGKPGGVVATGSLLWSPTRLTSVRAEANYEFVESFVVASPGFWRTQYTVTVSHEIQRDLIGIVRAVKTERDFEAINREDEVYGGDLGLRYRLDRGLFVDGEYRYRHQETTGSSRGEYSRNTALMRVRKAF